MSECAGLSARVLFISALGFAQGFFKLLMRQVDFFLVGCRMYKAVNIDIAAPPPSRFFEIRKYMRSDA